MCGRVLVVEPDERLKRMIIWILDEAGFEVEAAPTPGAAADRAAAYAPDVVVLDINAVGEPDWPAVSCLSERAGVLALSQSQREPERPPIHAVLHRPFDADTLVEAVSALADAGPDPDPAA
jgi:DNA-binding response OmpR family regulator